MRISLYIILFPFFIFSQNAINDNNTLSKKNKIIHLSYDFGMKCYTGNSFLNQQKFWNICEKNPEIGFTVMKNIGKLLVNNLNRTNNQVLKLTTALGLMLD